MIWTPAFAGVTGEGARPRTTPPIMQAGPGIQFPRSCRRRPASSYIR